MVAVCVGPELEPGPDGRLRIHLCGSPPEQAWPDACAPGAANGLRIDPDCGLWAPAPPVVAVVSASGFTAELNQLVPAEFMVADTATISITNPDPCREAMVFMLVSSDVDVSLPPGGDAHVSARLDGNEYFDIENPAPATGTQMSFTHIEHTQAIPGGALIGPGATQTFDAVIEVGQGTGGARYRGCRWGIHALVFAGMS